MNEVSANAAPRRRPSPLLASLALLLALLALALVAWSLWQQRRARSEADARAMQLQARIEAVEHGESADATQQQALARRLDALDSDLRADRDSAQGIDQRMHNLEAALGALSDQRLRGHDVLLLDDAEFLLLAEQQRLALLHDTDGALRACQLAAQALAHVQNPAFAPARESTANECAALAQNAPQATQALATLSSLRRQVPDLQPIEPHTEEGAAGKGWWSKLRDAFGGILRIRRDNAAPLAPVDAHLARELLQLDLAQAQAALLADDQPSYHDAVARASTLLDTRFEKSRPAVRTALSELGKLDAAHPEEAVIAPGNALAVLRGLRASHGLQSTLPLPATSTGAHQK